MTTSDQLGTLAFQRVSRRRVLIRRFCRNRFAVGAVVVMILLVAYPVIGPLISAWEYTELDFLSLQQPPSAEHWLGTDSAGGDLFVLAAHGLGKSLLIGFIASIGGNLIAAFVGTGIAYFGGKIEKSGVWLLDMAIVIPTFFLLAIVVNQTSSASGWIWLTLALTFFYWFFPARVYRSMAMSLREREFVMASRFMGVPATRIVGQHLVPNLGSVLIINVTLGVVGNVEAETGLSFIGFGISPPDTSLGVLIRDGSANLLSAPWLFLVPAGLLVLLCLSMQLIADGLRDAMDPTAATGSGVSK